VFEAQTFSNFFRFPMLFLCGLFIPVTDLPKVLRPLSYALPLTYGVDLLKQAINYEGHINPLISLVVLVSFSVVLFALSLRNVRRKWIY
jgi:ABC-2 type transport system permease protein